MFSSVDEMKASVKRENARSYWGTSPKEHAGRFAAFVLACYDAGQPVADFAAGPIDGKSHATAEDAEAARIEHERFSGDRAIVEAL